jgi:hypothetical protein
MGGARHRHEAAPGATAPNPLRWSVTAKDWTRLKGDGEHQPTGWCPPPACEREPGAPYGVAPRTEVQAFLDAASLAPPLKIR